MPSGLLVVKLSFGSQDLTQYCSLKVLKLPVRVGEAKGHGSIGFQPVPRDHCARPAKSATSSCLKVVLNWCKHRLEAYDTIARRPCRHRLNP